ncbi:hypothetical protein BASA82_000138 [Batrachochytrium salamandrivorans]|nr:hypothetical protein BASA81_001630 [Batrachochytrium salamandrivorans]KAH9262846.1 hypothetical protein BASA82_000138 [Batrachochytrium salamandrivorans]
MSSSSSASAKSEAPKKIGRTPSLHGFLTQSAEEKEALYQQLAEAKKQERLKEMTGDYKKASAEASKRS